MNERERDELEMEMARYDLSEALKFGDVEEIRYHRQRIIKLANERIAKGGAKCLSS